MISDKNDGHCSVGCSWNFHEKIEWYLYSMVERTISAKKDHHCSAWCFGKWPKKIKRPWYINLIERISDAGKKDCYCYAIQDVCRTGILIFAKVCFTCTL